MFIIVIIGIVLFVIVLLILEFVIRSAIDSSETARDIRKIREILSKKYSIPDDSERNITEKNYYIGDIPIDECPACHSKISPEDRICSSCGILLMIEDNND